MSDNWSDCDACILYRSCAKAPPEPLTKHPKQNQMKHRFTSDFLQAKTDVCNENIPLACTTKVLLQSGS